MDELGVVRGASPPYLDSVPLCPDEAALCGVPPTGGIRFSVCLYWWTSLSHARAPSAAYSLAKGHTLPQVHNSTTACAVTLCFSYRAKGVGAAIITTSTRGDGNVRLSRQ